MAQYQTLMTWPLKSGYIIIINPVVKVRRRCR